MQSKQNKATEARLLKEIFASLSKDEQCTLTAEIALDLKVTSRSVENWTRYGRTPGNWSQRRDVARIVKNRLKLDTAVNILATTLFS